MSHSAGGPRDVTRMCRGVVVPYFLFCTSANSHHGTPMSHPVGRPQYVTRMCHGGGDAHVAEFVRWISRVCEVCLKFQGFVRLILKMQVTRLKTISKANLALFRHGRPTDTITHGEPHQKTISGQLGTINVKLLPPSIPSYNS